MRSPSSARALGVLPCAIVIGVAIAGATGCYRVSAIEPRVSRSETSRQRWEHFFLLGAIGEAEVDVRRRCPGPAATVEVGGNGLTFVATLLTLGIYAPRTVTVTCSHAPAASPDSDAVREP